MKLAFLDRVEQRLQHPHAFWAILLLALALSAPSVTIRFFSDDYVLFAYLEQVLPGSPPWYDLYRFFSGDAGGPVVGAPWWAHPELKIHLVRPLSSALLALERALFGDHPLGYHLVSIALYLSVVAAAGKLFQRVLPGATAMLAMLLFAINEDHAMPLGWIACQHLLIATLSVVLGLLAYIRYREEDWRPGLVLGPLGLGIGLLGGEAALGGAAYWVAYQLSRPAPGGAAGWRPRLASALPVLGLVAYFAAYKAVGGGAANTGGYIDPLATPLRFAAAATERLPVLLGNAFLSIPADISTAFPSGPFVAAGLAAIAGVALLYRGCHGAIPERERLALSWLVPGAALALVVTLGGFPGARLLLLPHLGLTPLLAVLVLRGLRRGPSPGLASSIRRAGAAFLAVVHLVLVPLLFLMGFASTAGFARQLEHVARTAEIGTPPAKRVFVAAGSDPMVSMYPAAILALEAPDTLSCWTMLSMTKADHRLTRTGPSSFLLEPVGRTMLTGAFETLYRSPDAPLAPGAQSNRCGATVRVLATEGGRPSQIEVDLGAPLEDPGLVLLAWRDGGLRRVVPPPVGGALDLPWSPGPLGVF